MDPVGPLFQDADPPSLGYGAVRHHLGEVVMSRVLEDLLALLKLEPIEENLFRGRSQDLGFRQLSVSYTHLTLPTNREV